MNDKIKYELVIKSPLGGDLEGLWRAAAQNPVEALRYE